MKVIGLTGGIATGKSEVTKILRKMKIPVFDADAAVHALYQNGIAAQYLKNICPEAIFGVKVDRSKLSGLILEHPNLLKKIESIVHPLVRDAEKNFLTEVAKSSAKVAVIDSPLLIETDHYKDMDFSILIAASRENQIKRAMMRPNMTKEKVKLLLAKQKSTAEKRKIVDLVIDNNATLGELEDQVRSAFGKLMDA